MTREEFNSLEVGDLLLHSYDEDDEAEEECVITGVSRAYKYDGDGNRGILTRHLCSDKEQGESQPRNLSCSILPTEEECLARGPEHVKLRLMTQEEFNALKVDDVVIITGGPTLILDPSNPVSILDSPNSSLKYRVAKVHRSYAGGIREQVHSVSLYPAEGTGKGDFTLSSLFRQDVALCVTREKLIESDFDA